MATEATTTPANEELRELARALDCFTEGDVLTLGNLKPNTLEAWRKRGKGPPYIVFGRTFLYPRVQLSDHLQALVRERRTVPARELL